MPDIYNETDHHVHLAGAGKWNRTISNSITVMPRTSGAPAE